MEPNLVEDDYLVARAQGGFLDAFELLVMRHQDGAYRFALRMLDDPQDPQDATQEAFVDAWRGLAGFTGASSFRNSSVSGEPGLPPTTMRSSATGRGACPTRKTIS
jgi:Sigma-70 region 2